MLHAMLDFETYSLERNAALISCGIVLFDSTGIKDTFYCNIIPHPEQHVSQSTLAWWEAQGAEAKEALSTNRLPFEQAVTQILEFLEPAEALWAKGSLNDIIWLESACSLAGKQLNIPYNRKYCMRTIEHFVSEPEDYVSPNVSHNALEDAKAQTLTLINILKGKL